MKYMLKMCFITNKNKYRLTDVLILQPAYLFYKIICIIIILFVNVKINIYFIHKFFNL
jgi:hypothetical protein